VSALEYDLLEKKPQLIPIYKYLSIDRFKYLFWNANRKSILEGKFAHKILPELLAKLDGSQTLGQILTAFDREKKEDIIETIVFLEEKGFLKEKTAAENDIPSAEKDYFKSLLNYYTHFTGEPLKYFNLLRNARVGLTLNGPLGFSAGLHLSSLGIGNLLIADNSVITADEIALCPSLTTASVGRSRAQVLKEKIEESNPYIQVAQIAVDLRPGSFSEFLDYSHFVLLCDEDNRGLLPAQFNREAVEADKSFLAVTLAGFSGKIGPVIIPGQTPCMSCLKSREAAVSENYTEEAKISAYLSDLRQPDFSYRPPAPMLAMLGQIAASETSKIICGYTKPATLGNMLYFNYRSLAITPHPVLKVPRCEVCSRLNGRPESRVWGF
jgi:thiazole/oxazole-forming peptide maturase SagC family component